MSVDLKTMIERAVDTADFLKLLSNPQRLMLACRLSEGERSVGQLEVDLNIKQPTLSRELSRLRDAGIIKPRRQGKEVFYTMTSQRMMQMINAVCKAEGQTGEHI